MIGDPTVLNQPAERQGGRPENAGSVSEFRPFFVEPVLMAFEIVFTATSTRHYKALDPRWRSAIKSCNEIHPRFEPALDSNGRITRLCEMEHPQYRLRIGGDRVFYDIEDLDGVILAIVPKANADRWLDELGKRWS